MSAQAEHFGLPVSTWLDAGAAALLVVDVQRYVADPRYDVTRYRPFSRGVDSDSYFGQVRSVVLPCIQDLLRFFRERSCPVYFLRYCTHDPAMQDMPLLWRTASQGLKDAAGRPYRLTPDAEATQIMAEVQPLEAETKSTAGGRMS